MNEQPIGSGAYPWMTYAKRDGREWSPSERDAAVRSVADAGLTMWEDFAHTPDDVTFAHAAAEAAGLETPSFYANVRLHEENWRDVVATFADVAKAVADVGGRFFNVNAEPIEWGEPLDKDDAQLARQTDAFAALNDACNNVGVRLVYHTHDAEMRRAAREVHRMLLGVPGMGFCFDPDWFYSGAGESNLAMLDWARLYGDRVELLHLRDRRAGGEWPQVLGEGAIDYAALLKLLKYDGPLLLEQAVSPSTALTLSAVDAHRQSAANLRAMLK